MQSTEHRVQSTEYRAQSTKSRVQSAEYRVQSIGCIVQSTVERVHSTEYRAQSAENRVHSTTIYCSDGYKLVCGRQWASRGSGISSGNFLALRFLFFPRVGKK